MQAEVYNWNLHRIDTDQRNALPDVVLRAAYELCGRPWLWRAWVQQEVFVQDISIFCGPQILTLQELQHLGRGPFSMYRQRVFNNDPNSAESLLMHKIYRAAQRPKPANTMDLTESNVSRTRYQDVPQ